MSEIQLRLLLKIINYNLRHKNKISITFQHLINGHLELRYIPNDINI